MVLAAHSPKVCMGSWVWFHGFKSHRSTTSLSGEGPQQLPITSSVLPPQWPGVHGVWTKRLRGQQRWIARQFKRHSGGSKVRARPSVSIPVVAGASFPYSVCHTATSEVGACFLRDGGTNTNVQPLLRGQEFVFRLQRIGGIMQLSDGQWRASNGWGQVGRWYHEVNCLTFVND